MPSLSLKASINYPFVGGPSGPSYDPYALDWFNRVEFAGGTITNANKTAFNTFFASIDQSTREALNIANIFVGIEGGNPFGGALQPLFTIGGNIGGTYATVLNSNFTSEDINKLTGLKGNGVDKKIVMNRPNYTTFNSRHLSVYVTEASSINPPSALGIQTLVGTDDAAASNIRNGIYQIGTTSPNANVIKGSANTRTLGVFNVALANLPSVNVVPAPDFYTINYVTNFLTLTNKNTSSGPLAVEGRNSAFAACGILGPHVGTTFSDARIAFASSGLLLPDGLYGKLQTLIGSLT
jgi:hypothetical protein